MAEIQFQEPQRMAPLAPRASAIARFVIKTGLAKTEREAQIVLLVLALIAFAATAFLFITNTPSSGPTPAELEEVMRG